MNNNPNSLVDVLANSSSPSGGDGRPGNTAEFLDQELGNNRHRPVTPIEEEQMETVKYPGSSPQDATSWFFPEHHGQDTMDLRADSFSPSRMSSESAQLNGINSGPLKQLQTAVTAKSSQNHQRTLDPRCHDSPGRCYCSVDGCDLRFEPFTSKWSRAQHESDSYTRIECSDSACSWSFTEESSTAAHF